METVQPKLRFPEFKGDWSNHTLEELTVKIGDGLHGTPLYVENSDVYFINGNNLIDGKIVINENSKKVSLETLKKNNKGLDENSILISINGTIGSISRYNDEKIMLGKSVGYFNFKQSKDFYFQILQSKKIQDYFISELTGSTIKNLSLKTLRETTIFQPSFSEQTKIANFLSAVDEKLNLLKEKKALLEEYKKGIMQKIFNQDPSESEQAKQIRFKDDNGEDFEEWEEKSLGSLCKITTGKLDANAMVEDGVYRFYTCAKDYYRIDKYAFDTEALLISGNGANVGYIHYYKGKFNAYQRTYILDGFNENIIYVKYFLQMNLPKRIKGEKNDGNTPYIVLSTLSEMDFLIPSIEEQTKIANFLSAIDEKIELVSNQIQDTQEYKKGLLQQMFV